jgi:anti-sigma factor RsiW
MTTEVQHTDVAAYALGLLDEDDRRAFEAHLAECTLCAAEFGDFAGMAELLDDVSPVEPADDGGEVIGMLRRRKTAERARRRRTALLGAAAGVTLLAGGGLAGGLTAGSAGPTRAAMPSHSSSFNDVFSAGEKLTGADAATGVRGMVAMRATGWGTDIGMELSHVKGPLVCTLVAVSRTGERRTVTEWGVPPQGYGFPGTPPSLQVHGGTAMDRADLARFDVEVEGSGRTLLSIPV